MERSDAGKQAAGAERTGTPELAQSLALEWLVAAWGGARNC